MIERLTAVKGFGRWTAEMFLMFRLHRPDVLPAGDLGIVTAIQRLYRLRKRPDAKRVLKIGEAWRPYRSVASWYLWQTLHEAAEATDKSGSGQASVLSAGLLSYRCALRHSSTNPTAIAMSVPRSLKNVCAPRERGGTWLEAASPASRLRT